MPDKKPDPTNAEILRAMQGMWGQQKDLIQGVEGRLASKIDGVEQKLQRKLDGVEQKLDQKLASTEKRLGDRLAQEIQDRPVVVHIDMSRVSELEKQVKELIQRVTDLETRSSTH